MLCSHLSQNKFIDHQNKDDAQSGERGTEQHVAPVSLEEESVLSLVKDNSAMLVASAIRALVAFGLCCVFLVVGFGVTLSHLSSLGGNLGLVSLALKIASLLYLLFAAFYLAFSIQLIYAQKYLWFEFWKKMREELLHDLSTYLLSKKSSEPKKATETNPQISALESRLLVRFVRFISKKLKLDALASDLDANHPGAVSKLMRRIESEVVEKHLISKPKHTMYLYLLVSILVAGFLLLWL